MKGEGRGDQKDEVKGEIPSIKKLLLLLLLLLKIKYLMLVIYFLKKLTITQNLIKI